MPKLEPSTMQVAGVIFKHPEITMSMNHFQTALPAAAPAAAACGSAQSVTARDTRIENETLMKTPLKTRAVALLAAFVVTLVVVHQVATYAYPYPEAAPVQMAQAPR